MPDSSQPGDSTAPSTSNPRASLIQTQLFRPPATTIGSGADALHFTSGSPAWHCAFSRNGEFLAACFGSPDPCVRIWKLNAENQQWVLQATLQGVHERTIRSIAFAPLASPTVLAAGSFDGTVSIWEYDEKTSNQWECTTQLEGHDNEVKCVVWNSTGSLLATCGRDKTVWLWESFLSGSIGGGDGGDFECIAVLNGHEGDVKCVAFAASHGQWGDGDEILVSGSYDDTIKIWAEDAGDWYCAMSIPDVHADTIWSLAVSPGSGRLVSGSADGSMAIFKSYTEKEKKERFPEEGSER
jgi:WD40 repeat protein